MLQPHQRRKYDIRLEDGTWVPTELGALIEGDVIRVTEPDGTPVLKDGQHILLVRERPMLIVSTLDSTTAL